MEAVKWLETIAQAVKTSGKRNSFVVLGTSEAELSSLRANPNAIALKVSQGWSVEKLGEYAVRPAYAAILALSRSRELLAQDLPATNTHFGSDKARFFISHAKLDGLPLAQSLSHVISQFSWLEQFYDAADIQPGDDFKDVLERGVLGSMLLVLRTDIYDLRSWCRQEMMWAEAYDRPALLVDARADLLSRASLLGFTGIPGVRIPDGNLVRVLMEGLREWVRIGVLQSRFKNVLNSKAAVEEKTELLSRPPSLTSLAEAIRRLKLKAHTNDQVIVVHSEPALETNYANAAQDLMRSSFPNGVVVSFKSFLAQLP
jgi:hypothetical protein